MTMFGFICASASAFSEEDQIVIEDLSKVQLRVEIDKIEKEFYRVFNILNKDDDLDITCNYLVPTNSHIETEVCEPKFVTDRRAQNASDSRVGIDMLLSPTALQVDLAEEFERLNETMSSILNESQYFKELSVILGVLGKRLEDISG